MPGPGGSAAGDSDSDSAEDAAARGTAAGGGSGSGAPTGGPVSGGAETAPGAGGDDVRLGELLREARLRRALTLAEVERDTRINRDYLEALESERYELLPAPVYARGFLRSYARHLGLDEQQVLLLLPSDLPRPSGLEPLAGLRRTRRAAFPALDRRTAAVLGAAVIVVLALAFALRLRGGEDAAPEQMEPAIATPMATATTAGSAGPAATVPPFEVGETPNFIGVDGESAQALLNQLGLQFVVIETAVADTRTGHVAAQAPAPGEAIEAGGSVTLVIASGLRE